jgi:hypothetical protein
VCWWLLSVRFCCYLAEVCWFPGLVDALLGLLLLSAVVLVRLLCCLALCGLLLVLEFVGGWFLSIVCGGGCSVGDFCFGGRGGLARRVMFICGVSRSE